MSNNTSIPGTELQAGYDAPAFNCPVCRNDDELAYTPTVIVGTDGTGTCHECRTTFDVTLSISWDE